MDKKLDTQFKSQQAGGSTGQQVNKSTSQRVNRSTSQQDDDGFKLSDLKAILTSRSFWLIALFCLIFYSSVKPFNKFSTSLMLNKYGFTEDSAFVNFVPSLLHLCSLCLTPVFGWLYDKKGHGTRFLIIGCLVLVASLLCFALPIFPTQGFAIILMVVLGIAYSMVPAVFWPIIPKVIPHRRLGTGYSVIFWIQNIGLSYVPLLIGIVLDRWCVTGTSSNGAPTYNYTLPMCIFACLALVSVFIATLIRKDDRRNHYGIEEPNI
jgi:MFS family permease